MVPLGALVTQHHLYNYSLLENVPQSYRSSVYLLCVDIVVNGIHLTIIARHVMNKSLRLYSSHQSKGWV